VTATTARRATLVAVVQAAVTVLCIPALILPDILPRWSITASLVGLAWVPLLGLLVTRRPFARTPVDVPLGLLLGLTVVNALTTADGSTTFPHVLKWVAGIALFYAIAGLLQATGWLRLSAWAVSLLGLALVPFVLFGVNWSGAKFSWLPVTPRDLFPHLLRPFWKPEGYAGFNPNMAGGVLAMIAPVPLARALFGRGARRGSGLATRLINGLLALLIGMALLLTQSRGAILALLVAASVMLATRDGRWWVAACALLVTGAFVFQALGFEAGATLELTSDAESAINSAAGRLELWSRAWSALQDFPYTGIGLGMSNHIMPLRYPSFRISPTGITDHAHNLFFATGVEMGYPGLIGLLAFLFGLLGAQWQACRRLVRARPRNGDALPLALGALGSAVVYCVHGLTDHVTFYARASLVAWVLLGVGMGVSLFTQKELP